MFLEVLPLLIISFIVLALLGFAYFITAKIYGAKLAIKAIIQLLVVLGVISIIRYFANLWFSPAQREVLTTIISSGFSLLLIILFISHIKGVKQVLKENKLHEIELGNNSFFLITGGLFFVLISLTSLYEFISKSLFSINSILFIVAEFGTGVLAFYKGIGKTIITDKGLFSLFGYTSWSKIKSYKWEEINKVPVLKIKITGSLLSLIWVSVIIPNNYKSIVQSYLTNEIST